MPDVAAVLERHARARRIGQQRAVVGEALIVELAECPQPPSLNVVASPFVLLARVALELRLADDEGRIVDAEIEAVAVAKLLVARPRPGRIAVEHREQQRDVLDRIDLQPDAGRRQRIGRAAARQIDRRDGRPIALQEHAC